VGVNGPECVLASASPRRRELLVSLGVRFECVAPVVDEQPLAGESPARLVERLARDKTLAGRAAGAVAAALPVLGADTEVVVDGEVLGKPADRGQAAAMLRRLSGRSHEVMTAVALADGTGLFSLVQITTVTFRSISEREIEDYCDSGEADDKAGAYGIQGRAGLFVSRLKGSYSGVVGLPLLETARLLARAGIGPLAETGR
jgi:septum formation protein